MWVATNHGLSSCDRDGEQRWTAADGLADDFRLLPGRRQQRQSVDRHQRGFSRCTTAKIDSFHPQDGLSQSTVYAICEDHEGSLWVGTKHGLNQFADRRTIPFTVREGLPSNDAGPDPARQVGRIWVGTLGAGVARYDGRRFMVLTKEQGLVSDTIIALEVGRARRTLGRHRSGTQSLAATGEVASTYTTEQGLPVQLDSLSVA